MFWEIEHLAEQGRGLYDVADRRLRARTGRCCKNPCFGRKSSHSKRKLLIALFCDNSATAIVASTWRHCDHDTSLYWPMPPRMSLLQHRICEIYLPDVVINLGEKPSLPVGYALCGRPGCQRVAAVALSLES